MERQKRKHLEKQGWAVGSAQDLLGLSDEEVAYVELKVALANAITTRRKQQRRSQIALAKKIGSSQSRVAKMEAADSSVSLDLMVRSLLSLGATRRDLAKALVAGSTAKRRARVSA
jgi:ribosome-binding protein aMBF1 (putative translation factor)